MSLELAKITFLTILKICLISSKLLASVDQDCLNSSFYIKNISVDLTKESINEARYQAEQKSKLIGFKRLINRLMIKHKELNFNKIDISSLVDYLKINNEANSRYIFLASIFFSGFTKLSLIKYNKSFLFFNLSNLL